MFIRNRGEELRRGVLWFRGTRRKRKITQSHAEVQSYAEEKKNYAESRGGAEIRKGKEKEELRKVARRCRVTQRKKRSLTGRYSKPILSFR